MPQPLDKYFKFLTNSIFQQVPVESRESTIKEGEFLQWRKGKHLLGLLLQLVLGNILKIGFMLCEHRCKSCRSVLQYITKKMLRNDAKVWASCEALLGYCIRFQIYTGKEDGN